MSVNLNKTINILLIEDNPGDVRLIEEILKESNINAQLKNIAHGDDALEYLRNQDLYKDSITPDLIILDWNIPKKTGLEVLSEIKRENELRLIPVIVLTSSDSDEDINNAYAERANCYLTKPIDLDDFAKVIKGIEEFWLNLAKLPRR